MICETVTMHPSVEATFCDWLKGQTDELPADLGPASIAPFYSDFLSKYHVEDWDISVDEFYSFCDDVVCGLRCSTCGDRQFPYFLPGDERCVRCAVH